jgi:hypothetical protein
MEDIWGKFLASLDMSLPEDGIASPQEEVVDKDDEGAINGQLIKISFDVIMFLNHDKTKYLMMQGNQRLTQMGEISLKEALGKYNKKPPSRRKGKE